MGARPPLPPRSRGGARPLDEGREFAVVWSQSAPARRLGMSYRRAWLLVEQINHAFQQPAVTAAIGGRQGGGAVLTASGKRVIELYRSIEQIAQSSAKEEFRAVGRLLRKGHTLRA